MLADLVGKGGRVRTVAVPLWVKAAVDAWLAAGITAGKLLRSIRKGGRVGKAGLGDWSVCSVVERPAKKSG